MSFDAVESIVQALLYEGHLLYPYRPSALKNQQRYLLGRLLPREFCVASGRSEAWMLQTECLITASPATELNVSVRFLQLVKCEKDGGEPAVPGTVEREVPVTARLQQIMSGSLRVAFSFSPQLEGAVTLSAEEVALGLFKLTVTVENLNSVIAGEGLDRALAQAMLSVHVLMRVDGGAFISLLDPPEPFRAFAASCRNIGVWPVLVGPELGQMMLAAPMILYDYPQIAPESPGDLFDATEIDELLSLRIQTLTEAEKRELSASGERAHAMLGRTDSLSEDQLLTLHGRLNRATIRKSADDVPSHDHEYQPGDRVRLRPRRAADALDILLNGQTATVVSVQRDFEDGVHLAVVVDDDPGRDFGEQGLPGHRFFYQPDEVERL